MPEPRPLDADERGQAVSDAQRAFVRHQDNLRRLGAVGQITVGMDPDLPPPVQWWARCHVTRQGVTVPVLVERFPSGLDALDRLSEEVAKR